MIIYAVKPDTHYRFMYPEDDVYKSEYWEFKCKPLLGKMPKQFSAYFHDESGEPIPDIACIGMMTFAFRRDVATALGDILETAGEVLPFYVENELWYLFNVLKSVDALDEENTTYEYDDGVIKLEYIDMAFKIEKLPESSLFKIPSDNHTIIYCADRRETDEQVLGNFFCAVAGHKFTGIEFVEVFDSDDP